MKKKRKREERTIRKDVFILSSELDICFTDM